MAENEHIHDDNCGCGEDEDLGTVTLTIEDDKEVECAILSIYPVGDNQYIALLPLDENGEANEESDVLIYRFIDNGEDEDPEIENIEDDEEYDAAADAFDELLDEEEFDDDSEDDEDAPADDADDPTAEKDL